MMSIPYIHSNEEFAVLLLDSYEFSVKPSTKPIERPGTSTPQTMKNISQRRIEPEELELTEISSQSTETELSGVETLETIPTKSTQLEVSKPGPSKAQHGFSVPHRGWKKTDIESVYVDPFELSIFTSEEGDDANLDSDEDYEPTEMSLRLSNPEAIPEVSFGDIEFSEGEGEGNEANEMLELEEEEQKKEPMDKSSLKILKIINSERAEEVVDESFIVYRQCLLELAKSACSQFCTVDQYCQKPVEVQQKVIGSALHLKWVCSDGHICQEWSSQPV
ncbi:uncharacterized protein [Argopecten irradians]|uniref:uncharacterized protein n=1 Tax=Argopecten irradians TaxID=31199 RepID=UPI0037100C2C